MKRYQILILLFGAALAIVAWASEPADQPPVALSMDTWRVDSTGNSIGASYTATGSGFFGIGAGLTQVDAAMLGGSPASAFSKPDTLIGDLLSHPAVAELEVSVAECAAQLDGGAHREMEPNDSASQANALCTGRVGGFLSMDADFWVLRNLLDEPDTGDLVFAFLNTFSDQSGQLGAGHSFDSTLNVIAADGLTSIEFDDDAGPAGSSVVAGAAVPTPGPIFFEVRDKDNDQNLFYELYSVVVPPTAAIAEMEPNDTTTSANPITEKLITGNLTSGETDQFSFFAASGDTILAICDEDADNDLMAADMALEIEDPNGSFLVPGTGDSTENAEAVSVVTFFTGVHFLQLTDLGLGNDTDYSCILRVL